eukprot:augustus_masked-scaffold_23-processed-gene-2.56-mRNA-1 protein AED:1.00 eAED:1.00 QI:0/0/0/0/1/1/2/348/901
MNFKYNGQIHDSLLSVISRFLEENEREDFIEFKSKEYKFEYDLLIDSQGKGKAREEGFTFRAPKKTKFVFNGDCQIKYANIEVDDEVYYKEISLNIASGCGGLQSMAEVEYAWLVFEGIDFVSSSPAKVKISPGSAVMFRKCNFSNISISSKGMVKCYDCIFSGKSDILFSSKKPCLLENCVFKNSNSGILIHLGDEVQQYRSVIKNCTFTGIDLGAKVIGVDQTLCQAEIRESTFNQCGFAVKGEFSALLLYENKIIKPKYMGISLVNCTTYLSQVKIMGAPCGLQVIGRESETGMYYCGFLQCEVGASFISDKVLSIDEELDNGLLRFVSIGCSSFAQNKVGLHLENYRGRVVGSTFVLPKQASIRFKYDAFNENLTGSTKITFPLYFESNNYFERNKSAELVSIENVLKRYMVQDKFIFSISSKEQSWLQIEALIQRIENARFSFNRVQRTEDMLLHLNSLRAVFSLDKSIQPRVINRFDFQQDLGWSCFLCTVPIDPQERHTLFPVSVLLDVLDAVTQIDKIIQLATILEQKKLDNTTALEAISNKLKQFQKNRLKMFVSTRPGGQFLYLQNLLDSRDISSLFYILCCFNKIPEYGLLPKSWKYSTEKVIITFLLSIIEACESCSTVSGFHPQWLQMTATEEILSNIEANLHFYSTEDVYDAESFRLFYKIAEKLLLSREAVPQLSSVLQIREQSIVIHRNLASDWLALLDRSISQNNRLVLSRKCPIKSVFSSSACLMPSPPHLWGLLNYNKMENLEFVLLKIATEVSEVNTRIILRETTVYDACSSDKTPWKIKMLAQSSECSICGVIIDELSILNPCDDISHIFCPECFRSEFKGVCPGGCKKLVPRYVLLQGQVRIEEIIKLQAKVFIETFDKYKSLKKKSWIPCPNYDCHGG